MSADEILARGLSTLNRFLDSDDPKIALKAVELLLRLHTRREKADAEDDTPAVPAPVRSEPPAAKTPAVTPSSTPAAPGAAPRGAGGSGGPTLGAGAERGEEPIGRLAVPGWTGVPGVPGIAGAPLPGRLALGRR